MANNPARALGGSALLLTRPRAASERFLASLEVEGLERLPVVISPLLQIVPLGDPVTLSSSAGVIFSSAQAPPLAPAGEGRAAYCVGARTAEAASGEGWQVKLVAETAEDLIDRIGDTKGPLLHLSGRHVRGDIAERLTAAGVPTRAQAIYDQELMPLSPEAMTLMARHSPVIVPLFSPRTAQQLRDQVADPTRLTIVALSTPVAEALAGWPLAELRVAKAPTAPEMREAVEMLLRQTTLP